MKVYFSLALLILINKFNAFSQWETMNGPFGGPNVNSVIVQGSSIYASNSVGLFRTSDYGQTWQVLSTGTANSTTAFTIFNSNLYLGSATGLFISYDNAVTWSQASTNSIRCFYNSGSELLLADNLGLKISSNGTNWTNLNFPQPSGGISSIYKNGSNISVGTLANGFYLSVDNGGSWTQLNLGLPTLNIQSVINFNNRYIVGTAQGIYYSNNNGQNWIASNITSGLIPCFHTIGSTIFSGDYNGGGVLKSSDNGITWAQINNGLFTTSILSMASDSLNIYAGSNGPVFKRPLSEVVQLNNLLLTSFPSNGGVTSGSGQFANGSSISIQATANFGYQFEGWYENSSLVSTSNPAIVLLNSDRNITANFSQVSSVKNQDFISDLKVFPNPSSGLIKIELNGINSNYKLCVSNSQGKIIFEQLINTVEEFLFDLNGFSNGLYVIQIFDNNGQIRNSKMIVLSYQQ
jgi:uncharacterized repeat protein (TIGR02543 family)